MERKSLNLELKADKAGDFSAVFSTLNTIDKDFDITLPGAFPAGKEVLVSAYMHESWQGALPVGKGIIQERENEAILEGQFNLNSQVGRDHYETVKFSGGLQEWSYGFNILDSAEETRDGQPVRILKALDVFEVSPVLRGAGENTRTLAIKSHDSYSNHADSVLDAVRELAERTRTRKATREKAGRALSDADLKRWQDIQGEADSLLEQIAADVQDGKAAADTDHKAAERLYAEYQKLRARMNGVPV